MNNSSPIATASASGGFVGAVVVLICLILAHFNYIIPAEGSTALVVLLTPLIHVLAVKYGFDPSEPNEVKPVTPTV